MRKTIHVKCSRTSLSYHPCERARTIPHGGDVDPVPGAVTPVCSHLLEHLIPEQPIAQEVKKVIDSGVLGAIKVLHVSNRALDVCIFSNPALLGMRICLSTSISRVSPITSLRMPLAFLYFIPWHRHSPNTSYFGSETWRRGYFRLVS